MSGRPASSRTTTPHGRRAPPSRFARLLGRDAARRRADARASTSRRRRSSASPRSSPSIGVGVLNAGIPVVCRGRGPGGPAARARGAEGEGPGRGPNGPRGRRGGHRRAGPRHIAIFVAASNVHLRYKLKMTPDEVVAASVRRSAGRRRPGLHVAFVTEDTVRAPFDFRRAALPAVQEAGADRLVVADTVGIMTPLTFRWYLQEFRRRVQPTDLSVHCHNDFGLAIANTLTALECGARAPHVCVNGLGERAGNASLEEVVVALESLYGVRTGIRTERPLRALAPGRGALGRPDPGEQGARRVQLVLPRGRDPHPRHPRPHADLRAAPARASSADIAR